MVSRAGRLLCGRLSYAEQEKELEAVENKGIGIKKAGAMGIVDGH